jgi:hypothetical protein
LEEEAPMKKTFLTLAAAGLLLSTAGLASAQESRIKERKANQQKRIGEGVEKGSLTPAETARLEHKESKLNKEIRHDRIENGGNLTNQEKRQINRQQNRLSKSIYKQKHDAQHQ